MVDITYLLNKAMVSWDGSEEKLVKDFKDIVNLIGSLPEPKTSETYYYRYSVLEEDEENKQARKEEILKEEFFKI